MDTVVAGALGALTVDILILPLDTIKVGCAVEMLQTSELSH